MTGTTISFRVDEQTAAELHALAGEFRSVADAIRHAIHAQYVASLYLQAEADAERLRNDPADLAEIAAINAEMDDSDAW